MFFRETHHKLYTQLDISMMYKIINRTAFNSIYLIVFFRTELPIISMTNLYSGPGPHFWTGNEHISGKETRKHNQDN